MWCIRERLSAARTYYVRTDGSNSNDGLTNTSGGAFLTIQHAVDVVADSIDPGSYNVTIQVGDGTYTAPVDLKAHLGSFATTAAAGKIVLKGNTSDPSLTVISTTSANAIRAVAAGLWYVQDLTLQTTTSGSGLFASGLSWIRFNNIRFGATAQTHVSAQQGGITQADGNYSIVGGTERHLSAILSGVAIVRNVTVTLTGTPAFSLQFAFIDLAGIFQADAVTFSGSATGQRYHVAANGVISTLGAGASYLPGNSAGSTATGGQYI